MKSLSNIVLLPSFLPFIMSNTSYSSDIMCMPEIENVHSQMNHGEFFSLHAQSVHMIDWQKKYCHAIYSFSGIFTIAD